MIFQQDRKYRINELYNRASIDSTSLFMVSEKDTSFIQSEVASKLLDRISQGEVCTEELLSEYAKYGTIGEVIQTLRQLERDGFITNSPLLLEPDQSAFWRHKGHNPDELVSLLSRRAIAIAAIGSQNISALVQACDTVGIKRSEDADLQFVVTDNFLNPALVTLNKQLGEQRKPWILLKLDGITPVLGPFFHAGNPSLACFECLRHRILLHDQTNRFYQSVKGNGSFLERPKAGHPLSRQIVANMAIFEAIDYFQTNECKSLVNQLVSLDTVTWQPTAHQLVKRPQCPECGDRGLLKRHPEPIILQSSEKTVSKLGGYRSKPAEETLAQYQHHVSPVTGIAPYLKTYFPVKEVPIFNYNSGKNMALQSKSMFWLNLHMRSGNGGKGKTEIQAKTGALCEAIERYSLMYHEETYGVQSSYKELENAIHPNGLMLFSEVQYQNRETINKDSVKFYALIPRQFDKNKIRSWTPVYSLTSGEFKYLPAVYCYAQYPDGGEKTLEAYPDSNGCAAGNTLEEAILQAYLELVERDAAAIWWYNCIPRQEVDLKSANNPYIDEIRAYYEQIGRSLYVLDISTDLNIPVFVAISHDLKAEKDKVIYAFGAHVSADIALERSVIELNQILPVVNHNKSGYLTQDKVFIDWLDKARLESLPYLVPTSNGKKDLLTDYPKQFEETIHGALQYCMKQTADLGMETLVLDLTQPDIGMPVVKVMVPGLRHFWRRTAPGRLYDVPVKMGWLATPHKEETLNPWSIFI